MEDPERRKLLKLIPRCVGIAALVAGNRLRGSHTPLGGSRNPVQPRQEEPENRRIPDQWRLVIRKRVKAVKPGDGEPSFRLLEEEVSWNPKETAIVIVDMWDNHHCKSAARRVAEMAPHLNRAIAAARSRGLLIIHSPSDCTDFYRNTPQRQRAREAPFAPAKVPFQWNHFNPKCEGPLEAKLEQAGCSCDTVEPCGPDFRAWKRQIATIKIEEPDAISDDGQEIYNLLESRQIGNVIVMGVHTNRCVLGRPFGIRQMVYLAKNVVLCRDLTDSYHRDPGRHLEGLERIIQHIEKYWCPTITSESLTGLPPFRFKAQ